MALLCSADPGRPVFGERLAYVRVEERPAAPLRCRVAAQRTVEGAARLAARSTLTSMAADGVTLPLRYVLSREALDGDRDEVTTR